MMQAKFLINTLLFAAALAVSGIGCADEEDKPTVRTAIMNPDAVKIKVEPRLRRQICVSHLTVEQEGAHLRNGQLLVLIGPLPHDGSYLIFATESLGPDLLWDSIPLIAAETGLMLPGDLMIYMLHPVRVLEVGQHPNWTDHPMNMVIRETEGNCPTHVEIRAYTHAGTTGFHGGVAHAKN